MKRAFVGLDLLRFSLAFYLMVYHTIHIYPHSQDLAFGELLGLGGFATSTFFLLSGFILAHVYYGDFPHFGDFPAKIRGGVRAFFVKRLANLYPIHLISLGLFLLVGAAGVNPINRFTLTMLEGAPVQSVFLGQAATAFNMLLNVLMLQAWNPLYIAINPPSWSLSTLLFFYLAFPLVAPRLLSSRHKPVLLGLIWFVYLIPPVLASAMQWSGAAAIGIVETNPLLRLPEFLGGVLLYGLLRDGDLHWMVSSAQRRMTIVTSIALSFVGASILLARGPWYWEYILHNGLLMPTEMALIVLCTIDTESAWLARTAARLGNAALSIFAIHLPLFLLFMKAQKLLFIGISPVACVQHFATCIAISKSAEPGMATYPVFLVGTVIVAVLFQEQVVVPLRDSLRRKFLNKREAVLNKRRMSTPI